MNQKLPKGTELRKENIRRAKGSTPAHRKASADAGITKFDKSEAKRLGFTSDLNGVQKMFSDRTSKSKKK